MIEKFDPKSGEQYANVPSALWERTDLSILEIRICLHLLSKPPKWKVSATEISQSLKANRTAVQDAMKRMLGKGIFSKILHNNAAVYVLHGNNLAQKSVGDDRQCLPAPTVSVNDNSVGGDFSECRSTPTTVSVADDTSVGGDRHYKEEEGRINKRLEGRISNTTQTTTSSSSKTGEQSLTSVETDIERERREQAELDEMDRRLAVLKDFKPMAGRTPKMSGLITANDRTALTGR